MAGTRTAPAWWAVGLSEEITADRPSSRRCGDTEIVLFRDVEGRVNALEDRCAHRRAPLSLGRITAEGWLQCGYHGWCYDGASGRCTAIPNLAADERVPATYGVRRYASVERDGFVYVRTDMEEVASVPLRLPFEAWAAHTNPASLLLTLPHEVFVASLLDGPWVTLSLEKVTIVPDHRIGDPAVVEGAVVTQFAADWTARFNRRKNALPDYPLMVRIAAAPVTGLANIQVLNDAEQPLLQATISSYPVRAGITAVHWRHAVTPLGYGSVAGCAVHEHPAAHGFLNMSELGLAAWRELSAAPVTSAVGRSEEDPWK